MMNRLFAGVMGCWIVLSTAAAGQNPSVPSATPANDPATSAPKAPVDPINANPAKFNPLIGPIASRYQYRPLTGRERWAVFVQGDLWSPGAYFKAVIPAAIDHISLEPKQWGGGVKAYSQRFGSRWAASGIQDGLEIGGGYLLHQDPRYLPCPCTNPWRRTGHAILQNIVTRNDQGHWVIRSAGIAATYASGFAQESWTPGGYDKWRAIRTANSQYYFGSIFNIVKEFLPDIRSRLQRRKTKADPLLAAPSH